MTRRIGGAVVNERTRDNLEFDSVAVYPGISIARFSGTSSANNAVALGDRLYLPFRGSVVGLSVHGGASATYRITLNGNNIGTALTTTSGQTSYKRGTLPVKAGDYLQVTGNSATGSVSLTAALFLVLDPATTI